MDQSPSGHPWVLPQVFVDPMPVLLWIREKMPESGNFFTVCFFTVAEKHGFAAHSYANDLQIYDHSPQSSCSSLVVRMSNCVAEINEWMGSNRPKLNPSKTELIWLGSSLRLEHCLVGELNIARVPIKLATHIRDLSIMTDNDLSLQVHINHVTRTCFYHLRQLRVVRHSLSPWSELLCRADSNTAMEFSLTGIASFTSHLFLLLWQAWRFMLLHTLQTVIKISNYIPSNYARKRLKGQNGKSRGLVRFKGLVHQLHLKQTVNQQSLFTVYNQMNRYLMSCGRAAKKFDDVCRNSRLWTKTFGKVFDQNTMQLLRKRLFRERKREILSKQKWKEFFGNTKNRFSFVKNYLQKRRRIKEKNHLQSCHVSHHTSSSSHVSSHVSSHSSSHVSSHVSSHSSSRVASRSGQHYRTLKQLHNNTKLTLYKKMPWRAISRLWGHINQFELPVWLRSPAIRLYIWMFNCCLEEAAEQDLKQYRNLSEFFRRLLRPGARPLAKSSILTSPADGRVLHCGQVKNGVLEQVKGVTYSIEGFLGPLESIIHQRKQSDNNDKMAASDYHNLLRNNNNQLYYCVIYLAPGDYHRFHSPATWTVKQRRHFPGELFSVNPSVARWLQGLFNFNERALYHGEWCYGFFSMTAVGATNVGSINVYFDEEMQTNCRCKWIPGCYYDKDFTQPSTENSGQISGSINNGHRLSRGQLFGEFNLGSTIVLLFEAPPNFQFTVQPGDRVYYGQSISKNYCRKDNGKYSKRGLVRQRHFRRNSISF